VYLHLAAGERAAAGVSAGPVAAGAAHGGCVLAELGEVPARAFGGVRAEVCPERKEGLM
jgi:hypothetical protein